MAKGGIRPGAGRKKGVPNKLTKDIKAALMAAFELAGGQDYLLTIAKTDPKTFCALLGKAMPMQMTGDPDNPLFPSKVQITLVHAAT